MVAAVWIASPQSRPAKAIKQRSILSAIAKCVLPVPIGAAVGVEAAKQRRRVLFVRAADLVRSLLEARDGRELRRLTRRLQAVDLLICDELGFVPFDRAGGELLFKQQQHSLYTSSSEESQHLAVSDRRVPSHVDAKKCTFWCTSSCEASWRISALQSQISRVSAR